MELFLKKSPIISLYIMNSLQSLTPPLQKYLISIAPSMQMTGNLFLPIYNLLLILLIIKILSSKAMFLNIDKDIHCQLDQLIFL